MSSEKHYIAVDRKMVMRCGWCGTAESSSWIQGDHGGGVYCSNTCMDADNVDKARDQTIVSLLVWFIFIIPSWLMLYDSQDLLMYSDLPLTIVVFITLFLSCPLSLSIAKLSAGRKARKKIPRNSRRLDKVFDERYLHCANCNAPLELMHGKISVKCSYCGFVNGVSYV